MRLAGVLSITDVHSWSDYALNLTNSAANIIGVIAAAIVLMAIALIYFTGPELTKRAKGKLVTPQQDQMKALRQSQAELATARGSEETKVSRLKKVEIELAAARRATDEKTLRLSQLGAELAIARRSAEKAETLVKQLERKQGPRKITPEQRTEFLNAIRGMPTGKVIVSAFSITRKRMSSARKS
jgi:hypothetical protein